MSDKALFLDFITAFLALFIEGRANHIVRSVFKPTYSDWDYLGPDVIFAVSGPFPMGEIEFSFSDEMADKLVNAGLDPDEVRGPQSFIFLHQFYTWHKQATEAGESGQHWDKMLLGVGEYSAKGLRYQKAFGGRELSACAAVLRDGTEAKT